MLLPLNFWSLLVSTLVEEEITWINLHARISFPFIFLGEDLSSQNWKSWPLPQKSPFFQSHNPRPIWKIKSFLLTVKLTNQNFAFIFQSFERKYWIDAEKLELVLITFTLNDKIFLLRNHLFNNKADKTETIIKLIKPKQFFYRFVIYKSSINIKG